MPFKVPFQEWLGSISLSEKHLTFGKELYAFHVMLNHCTCTCLAIVILDGNTVTMPLLCMFLVEEMYGRRAWLIHTSKFLCMIIIHGDTFSMYVYLLYNLCNSVQVRIHVRLYS